MHDGIGFVGNRGGLQGKACGVCPVRSQTEPVHHHFPLSPFALWHGDLLTTGGRRCQRARTVHSCLSRHFENRNDSQSLATVARSVKSPRNIQVGSVFSWVIAWRRRLGFWDDARWARRQVVGGHPFPQLQLDAGEWPVIAVAWDGQQASNLRLFLTFRIATEQGGSSGKNS